MSDSTVAKILTALKAQRQKQLEWLGDYPKPDAFEHGVQVGSYRGVGYALDTIEEILRDDREEEARR